MIEECPVRTPARKKGRPGSLLRIDVSGLSPSLIRTVTGNLPGLSAGGGTEFLFDQFIDASRITKIR
jgi:hypothetical protein